MNNNKTDVVLTTRSNQGTTVAIYFNNAEILGMTAFFTDRFEGTNKTMASAIKMFMMSCVHADLANKTQEVSVVEGT